MEISESLINGESGNYLRIREIGRETSFPLTLKGTKSKLNVKIAKNPLKRQTKAKRKLAKRKQNITQLNCAY